MSLLTRKLRTVLSWIAVAATALILYLVYSEKLEVQHSGETTSPTASTREGHSDPTIAGQSFGTVAPISGEVSTTDNLANAIEWIPGDQAQKEQLLRWKAERGWHDMLSADFNGAPDYRTYSRDMLEQLGEQGDLRALHTLSRLPISPAERQNVLTKAAVYGSTFALFQLSNLVSAEPNYEPNPTEERKRQAIVEALAYVEVARIRGEGGSVDGKVKEIAQTFQSHLSDSEVERLENRTWEIYSDLANQRKQLGLPEFDNSAHPVAEAYDRYMKQ